MNRTVASQMQSAEFERTVVDIADEKKTSLEQMALLKNLMDF